MPLTQKHLVAEGTYFRKHYCTIAICCPSRVSLLTGQQAHNTNVTYVTPPHGGYPKFVSQGYNEKYLPVWLQEAGYNTYYTGKLFNAHSTSNWNNPKPKGWTGSDFLLDPNTYLYENATFQRNDDPPQTFPGLYSGDLVQERALGFLDDALASADKPFFLGIAPIGPHNNGSGGETSADATPPVPAARHANLFPDVTVPRTYNFNPDKPSVAAWGLTIPQLNESQVAWGDYYHRRRLQALQSVDELVDAVLQKLDAAGILEDTYVFYTSDNGFHIGQHRFNPGKTCAIEEDINVPLVVRGPGVPRGKVVEEFATSHTDIAPTLFSLAGIEPRGEFDGSAIPLTEEGIGKAVGDPRRDHVQIEFWGTIRGYPVFNGVEANNTYKALRVIGEDYSLFYSVWCSNERELYDMKVDPGQMDNLADLSLDSNATLLDRPLGAVQDRLDALLLVLKSCKADSCRYPWKQIHPEGDVNNLRDALDRRFDEFYKGGQNKVAFEECKVFYDKGVEGPLEVVRFGDWDP